MLAWVANKLAAFLDAAALSVATEAAVAALTLAAALSDATAALSDALAAAPVELVVVLTTVVFLVIFKMEPGTNTGFYVIFVVVLVIFC